MKRLLKKVAKLQHLYSTPDGEINKEKREAKKFGIELMNENVKGNILDIGGEEFYHKDSTNITSYNLPNDMHLLDEVEQYEGIISMHTLEHSPAPLLVIENIYRALKKGGYFYVAVPKPSDFFEVGFPDHLTMMSAHMWKKLLEIAGFEIVHRSSAKFNPNDDWIENRFLCKK